MLLADDSYWDQNAFNDLVRRGVDTTKREDRLFRWAVDFTCQPVGNPGRCLFKGVCVQGPSVYLRLIWPQHQAGCGLSVPEHSASCPICFQDCIVGPSLPRLTRALGSQVLDPPFTSKASRSSLPANLICGQKQ